MKRATLQQISLLKEGFLAKRENSGTLSKIDELIKTDLSSVQTGNKPFVVKNPSGFFDDMVDDTTLWETIGTYFENIKTLPIYLLFIKNKLLSLHYQFSEMREFPGYKSYFKEVILKINEKIKETNEEEDLLLLKKTLHSCLFFLFLVERKQYDSWFDLINANEKSFLPRALEIIKEERSQNLEATTSKGEIGHEFNKEEVTKSRKKVRQKIEAEQEVEQEVEQKNINKFYIFAEIIGMVILFFLDKIVSSLPISRESKERIFHKPDDVPNNFEHLKKLVREKFSGRE